MTPEQRIMDCRELVHEIRRGPQMPWFTSTARFKQQDDNHAASTFNWMVREARRFNDDEEMWGIIQEKLRDHEANAVH